MTASAQKATGESLSIAEAGVARVQALMNNVRPITTTNLQGWRAAAEPYRTATLPNGCASTSASSVDVRGYVDANGSGSWVAVTNGQFRIRRYSYDDDTSTGALEIEGQALRNGQTLAIAPLQVTIPVTPSESMPVPGLWARNIPNIGNNQLDATVQLVGCKNSSNQVLDSSGSTSAIGSSSITGANHQLIVNPYPPYQNFPSLPSLPGPACSGSVTSNCYYEIPALTGTTVAGSAQAKLPRVNSSGQIIDKPINGNYYYLVNNNLAGELSISSPTLTVDTGYGKVILFLKGNMDTREDSAITHINTATNTEGVPTDFQIYGSNGTENYYCPSGSTCTTSSIQLGGNKTLNAFIFAPSANAGANVCNPNNPKPSNDSVPCLNGFLWVNNWNRSYTGTTSNVITQPATANYWPELRSLIGSIVKLTPPPQPIKPISIWQREAR